MMKPRSLLVVLLVLAALGAAAGPALAAPPPNDNRADALVSSMPATLDGTTVEATREANEPSSECASDGGSVWYRVTAPRAGRIIVGFAANGDLDAVVDVYRVRRSQLASVTCDTSDEKGKAQLDFGVAEKDVYLIRVAQLSNSVSDTFRLNLQLAQPDATPPGPPLPRGGASGTLHRVLNPSDAWSVDLREGVTYRFNMASKACTPLLLYRPGISSFDDSSPVRRLNCGGYMLFTPNVGNSGRYSLLAVASGSKKGKTPYKLFAGRAGADDTAPGIFIRNYARAKGHVNANGLDVTDLYRFDVTHRSNLELSLATTASLSLKLVTARGKRIETSLGNIDVRVPAGRYFVLVRAHRGEAGKYTLRRVSRTITRTRSLVNGKKDARMGPGGSASLQVRITPGVRGPVELRLQRFD